MAEAPRSYTIQGRTVSLPCVVREASSAAATYLVNAATARRLLPGPELEVVELWPGYALASLACIDYKDNDLGNYNEISIAFFVRERGAQHGLPLIGPITDFFRARLPTYIHRLPVNQAFTCEAGRTIWGFPKVVQEIDFVYRERRAVCTWRSEGQHVLTFSVPRGGTQRMPDASLVTYSYLDGAPHRTAFTSGGEGVGFRLGGATLDLGTHPIAGELRGLGFPRRALLSTWIERMHGRFEAPEKL